MSTKQPENKSASFSSLPKLANPVSQNQAEIVYIKPSSSSLDSDITKLDKLRATCLLNSLVRRRLHHWQQNPSQRQIHRQVNRQIQRGHPSQVERRGSPLYSIRRFPNRRKGTWTGFPSQVQTKLDFTPNRSRIFPLKRQKSVHRQNDFLVEQSLLFSGSFKRTQTQFIVYRQFAAFEPFFESKCFFKSSDLTFSRNLLETKVLTSKKTWFLRNKVSI